MGNLILTRSLDIQRPYYVQELGVHLYSAEELCFYIYNNLVLIDEDFADERLLDFLHQLELPRLEERVLRVKEQGGLYDVLYAILQEVRYYNSSELFAFRKQLEVQSRSSRISRLKSKADVLFERGQYYAALRSYNQLLEQDGRELADGNFVAMIWQNKAACYARTDHFQEAMEDLQNAYLLSRDVGLAEKMYGLNRLMGLDELPSLVQDMVTPEMLNQYRSNWDNRWKLSAYQGKALEAAALEDQSEPERSRAYQEMIFRWKEEYRRTQRT